MSSEPLSVSSDRAFSETSDPAAYVPRAGTEAALESIRAWGESDGAGSTLAALISQPGLGKTQLLRVTEARVNGEASSGFAAPISPGVRALYVPYGGLDLEDFCVWVYGLLGRGIRDGKVAPNEEEALAAMLALGRSAADPFYLLIDDADSMPESTIRLLATGLPPTESPLRILMALNSDSRASRLISQFIALAPHEIRFSERLSVEETADYLAQRMRWAGFSEAAIGALPEDWIHRVHSLSAGIPRALHGLAARYFDDHLRGRVSDLDRKQQREDWMGRPIEDDLEI